MGGAPARNVAAGKRDQTSPSAPIGAVARTRRAVLPHRCGRLEGGGGTDHYPIESTAHGHSYVRADRGAPRATRHAAATARPAERRHLSDAGARRALIGY